MKSKSNNQEKTVKKMKYGADDNSLSKLMCKGLRNNQQYPLLSIQNEEEKENFIHLANIIEDISVDDDSKE